MEENETSAKEGEIVCASSQRKKVVAKPEAKNT
jgi:hypothetical protein